MLRVSELLARQFSGTTIWQTRLKKGPTAPTATTILFFLILITLTFISAIHLYPSKVSAYISTNFTITISEKHQTPTKRIEFPLNCSIGNQTQSCPTNYPKTFNPINDLDPSPRPVCPEYFRWIHEDLRPWKATGITRDMVEKAKGSAHFRLVIVRGKAYIERYKKSIQTRDVFTIWGILQLLRLYPGRIPDLELMFDCNDRPVIRSDGYNMKLAPPPLFRYCGNRWTMDIVFPDWSFWGWSEINIKPWESLLKELKEGNKRSKWIKREPYAYWKGNPAVAETRRDLLKAMSLTNKTGMLAYMPRYKIYIEGWSWSVSEKYILACESVTLLVKPTYYDFFTRGLKPVHHYWPIRDEDQCKSIKFAVDWGNNHKQKAQAIGKAASDFIQEELKMDYVYDYMFHLLNKYARLFKFEPKIPEGAMELCSETMACSANGLEKKFMMESLVKGPSATSPCTMPPIYEPRVLGNLHRRNMNIIRQVEKWENK
ncbi:hypothetical protein ACJW30_10G064700 [Castanea mollissima]